MNGNRPQMRKTHVNTGLRKKLLRDGTYLCRKKVRLLFLVYMGHLSAYFENFYRLSDITKQTFIKPFYGIVYRVLRTLNVLEVFMVEIRG